MSLNSKRNVLRLRKTLSKSTKVHACCVATCENSLSDKPELSYFALPKDEDRRVEWLLAAGREDLIEQVPKDSKVHKYYTVCEKHFAREAMVTINSRKKLTSELCIPTLYIPNQKLKKGKLTTVSKMCTQTPPIVEDTLKQIEMYSKSDKTNKTLELILKRKLVKLSEKYGKKDMQEILQCAIKNLGVKNLTKVFDNYNTQCLHLYNKSSPIYHLLQNVVPLPGPQALIDKELITTEINEKLLEIIRLKVSKMDLIDTHCILVVDSMPLTPHLSYSEKENKIVGLEEVNGSMEKFPAERALVVILKGIISEWQLVVGYALLTNSKKRDSVTQWINELLIKLTDAGLLIRTLSFASDTEAESFESNWVTNEAPYFFVQNRKMFFVNDLKALINTLRNEFRVFNIMYDNNVAKYKHIEDFLAIDKQSPYRLAPKLTEANLTSSAKDVCASEIFSKAVASGLMTYIDCKLIPKEARATAHLISMINNVIELLNFNYYSLEEYKRMNNKETRVFQFSKARVLIKKLNLIDQVSGQYTTYTSKFIHGFLLNMNSYQDLLEDLKLDLPPHILINFQNQGLSEEFFKQIRLRSGGVTKPTAEQFIVAYKQLFILSLQNPVKKRTMNNEMNNENYFKTSRKIFGVKTHAIQEFNSAPSSVTIDLCSNKTYHYIPISELDYHHIDRAERHTSIYVSAFLLKKCKEHHKLCPKFKKYVEGTSDHITINHLSRYLLYSQKRQICFRAIPCNHFIVLVETLENVFRRVINEKSTRNNLEKEMFEAAKDINFGTPPCSCFPWQYFIKLFFRLRLNYTLNFNNREFKRGQLHFMIPLLLPEFLSVNSK